MRTPRILLPILLLLLAAPLLAACEQDVILVGDPIQAPGESAMTGLWVGTEHVSGAFDSHGEGFSFRVALQLFADGTFVLRSVDYPPASTETQPTRLCTGVYAVRGWNMEFFPDYACPALPLNRFRIGSAGSRLLLEAFTTQVISIRVQMALERA